MATILFLFLIILASTSATSKSTRIYGGHFAEENQFPYSAVLYSKDFFICGAAILNDRFILTAAHCVKSDPKTYRVMVGSNTLEPPGVMYQVKEKYVHDKYKPCVVDIAILELETAMNFSKSIAPIEIFEGEIPVGEKVIISGWGETGDDISNELKYVEVEIGDPKICLETSSVFRHDSVLCLAHKVGEGACFGDSGGPAAYKGKLVGETMCLFGGCGTPKPDGYQKVSYFSKWIKDIAFKG